MELIIGTYTERLPHVDGKADGILTVSFDAASGRFGDVTTLAGMRNPSYLTVSGSGERVYAVSEVEAPDGEQPAGRVAAFARDPRTGELTRLNESSTHGNAPCYLTLDRAGRFLLTANYGSGSVAVHALGADGRLADLTDLAEHTGSGPNAERQDSAHSHMTGIDPVTGDVLVCDLGSDTIFRYALDGAGRLIPKERLKQPPGAGPRHLAFHPDGRHLFVTNELGGTVTALRRAGDGFAALGATATIPATARVENLPGAIRVSASGRHVLVSNRGHDSIAVFAFDPAGETLSLLGTTPAEGQCPRDFIFTPDGARIIVANQDSDVLASYTFDDETGTLRFLHRAPAPTPVCLVLA